MADIFREVDEEVRKERFEQLWKKYRDHILAAAALVVIAAAGVQLYRVYEQREEEKAAVAYAAAVQLMDAGQPAAATPQLEALAKTAPSGYAQIARLAEADSLFAAGSPGAAIRLYRQIASGGDPYLAAVARLREAWALVDGSSRSEIRTLLTPLTDPASPWHQMAGEVLAYSNLRAGNASAALQAYQAIAADTNSPQSLRSRARAMVLFLKAGGDANYGTVPTPKAPPAPTQATKTTSAVPVR